MSNLRDLSVNISNAHGTEDTMPGTKHTLEKRKLISRNTTYIMLYVNYISIKLVGAIKKKGRHLLEENLAISPDILC